MTYDPASIGSIASQLSGSDRPATRKPADIAPMKRPYDLSDAFRLIGVLRERGLSVHITGMRGAEVQVTSSMEESSDMSWAGFGDTTEEALFAAARACLTDFDETARLLADALPDNSQ